MLPIFVIALKDSTKRRELMSARMATLDLKFEFIDAVLGKALPEAEKQRLTSKKRQDIYPAPLSDGAIGCLMSHRHIWQKIVSQNIDMAVILEDDADFSDDMAEVLEKLSYLKTRFDVINLHHQGRMLVDIAKISDDYRLTITRYNSFGTIGYVITKDAAAKLLKLNTPFIYEVDVMINRWWEHGLQTLVLQPSIARENGLDSTIGYPSKKPSWGNDKWYHYFKRRFHRLRDSMVKRRSFAAMVATAKMRLMGTDPNDTRFNPEYPDLRPLIGGTARNKNNGN